MLYCENIYSPYGNLKAFCFSNSLLYLGVIILKHSKPHRSQIWHILFDAHAAEK